MAHVHDPRTVPVPTEILDAAKTYLAELGPLRAGRRLGISRNALLGMVATGYGMPGTVALATQALKAEAA
jgi:hypothetical protein